MRTLLTSLLCVVLACALAAAAVPYYVRHAAGGFSARAQPTHLEAALAHTALRLATPDKTRQRKNPVTLTPATLQAAMAHYADHCAQCHAGNGSGETMLGAGMYPKPPDMRQSATQGKTDGELFSAIENGVRLSGMPAFGDGNEEESWQLVAFIRHLPSLMPQEEDAMQHLTPRSPAEFKEEQEEADFLNGTGPGSRATHQGK